MAGILQVAFDGFKIIDLGRTIALTVHQSLYRDNSDLVGLNSIVQAFGLMHPCDRAVDDFKEKWTKGSGRWKLPGTGIEIITGKSSTTGEMVKTRNGEVALLILSFFIEELDVKVTSDVARRIINETPAGLLETMPERKQVADTVSAVQSQTGHVSWQQEIINAQNCVGEPPVPWDNGPPAFRESKNIPVEGITTFFRALCAVSRFPKDHYCILRTNLSITLAFVLAHTICGLRVCVIVDGDVIHGDSITGQWQVKLDQEGRKHVSTEVKLGRKLDDPEVLLKINEVGPRRANRISINGIARAATIGQGLDIDESNDIAELALWAANSILARWQRGFVKERRSGLDVSSTNSGESGNANDPGGLVRLGPVKSRLTIDAICTWWGCPEKTGLKMLQAAEQLATKKHSGVSWSQLPFSRKIRGKISAFKDLDDGQQMAQRWNNYNAFDKNDFGRLTHLLTTQLLLIAMLKGQTENHEQVRVRSSCSPVYSALGAAIKKFDKLKPLCVSDVLSSWYFWLNNGPPNEPNGDYGLDVVATNGYIIYRSLLVDRSLNPSSCETVIIEPGHICLDNRRLAEIRGWSVDFPVSYVKGKACFHERLQEKAKLKPQDHTGRIALDWTAFDDEDFSLDLKMSLKSRYSDGDSGIQASVSVYQLSQMSWRLEYGDQTLGCDHAEYHVGEVFEGEEVDVLSAGNLYENVLGYSPGQAFLLFSANNNDLGQIACLLSAPPGYKGMVRRQACLRCCITACNRRGLHFLID